MNLEGPPPQMSKVVDIISQMRKLEGAFPKREQKVADYVLGNLEKVAYQRLSEIAEASGVSDATVNRFCQTLGCAGFKDFRISIAQNVAVSLPYLGEQSDDPAPKDQLVTQIFGALIDTLNLARNQLDTGPLQAAIKAMAAADRIAFYGVGGSSANAAREGANRLFRLGIPAESHSDGYLQRMLASTLDEGSVLFTISSSGSPAELLDSVAIARQYGAQTISLTKTGSELAQATQISIEVDLPEDQDIFKPTSSRLVFIAIIDVLATGVARARSEIVKEKLRRIRSSLAPLSKDVGPKPVGD